MKLRKIRVAAVLTAAALFLCVGIPGVSALDVSAQRAVLLDAESGRVLYGKRESEPGLIASTTKIMTALVVCNRCNVLDRVEIPKEAVGIEGSSMYLKAGEILTVQELLYGLMLHSGNDAAAALAIYCAGTVEGFVELMNDEAQRLGLENTHFANPHGLDAEDHYSSTLDLAKLTAEAMRDPIFAQTVGTKSVQIGDRSLTNHNKLLWRYEGAEGVKTGYTKAAGRILVSSAVRNGRRLIAVTMNAPDDWNDHVRMMDEGFSRFTVRTLCRAGETMIRLPILTGQFADLLAAEDAAYPLENTEKAELRYVGEKLLFMPPCAGQEAGKMQVVVGGCTVAEIPLIYGETN